MSRSKIVFYGHFGSGNIGNDSSLEAALFNIRARLPKTRIVCVCNGPERIAERFAIEVTAIDAFHVRRHRALRDSTWARVWRRARRMFEEIKFLAARAVWFRDASLFVVVGTGAVDDMAVSGPWGAPYALFKWCLAAKLGGARVVFLSVGVGPIYHPLSRRLMFGALRLASRRSYRETAAVEYLGRYGVDTRQDSIYPDLVFSMDMRRWEQGPDMAGSRVRIGLGLINYLGWRHDPAEGAPIFRSYMEKIKSFLRWLLERGHTVRLLVGDTTDSPCVDEIRDFMQTEPLHAYRTRLIIEEITSVDTLLEQIGQTDVVVASRFHNVLCALMMKRPVISIGYHEKNDLLMAGFGLAEYCQHIESFKVERLRMQFEDCVAHHSEIVESVGARLGDYRRLLEVQYAALVEMHKTAY